MAHVCLTCRPGPDRIVDHERRVIHVPAAFRGPPTSMHGGAAAGMVACLGDAYLIEPTARFNVRLHGPPPLRSDLPFELDVSNGRHRLQFRIGSPDGGTVLSGWAATKTASRDLPPAVPADIVDRLAANAEPSAAQRERWDTEGERTDNVSEEFSECFGCGAENPDSLGLRTRLIDDDRAWVSWTPPARWHDDGGLASLAAIAALDCTSAQPLRPLGFCTAEETTLLGTYEGDIHCRPPATVPGDFRIVTAPRRRDGRKIVADIGLFSPAGEVFITGSATWIVLAPT